MRLLVKMRRSMQSESVQLCISVLLLTLCGLAKAQVPTVMQDFYSVLNDGRCLFANVSMSVATAYNQIHCSGLCNVNANCSMYMYMMTNSKCYLYPKMTYSFYTANSYLSPGSSCKVYSTGWGSCPYSPWVLENKYYYVYPTQTNISQAMNICSSAYQLLLKVDSVAELQYISSVIMPKDPVSPKYYWTSLYGSIPYGSYSSANNLTWLSDGSSIAQTAFPSAWWFVDGIYPPNLYCFIIWPDGRLADNSCDYSGYAGRPLCTCDNN